MRYKSLLWVLVSLSFVGCASTQQTSSSLNRMHVKIADLERKLEEKDREIVELKYDIKDLNLQLENSAGAIVIEEPVIEYERSFSPPTMAGSQPVGSDPYNEIIRVPVKPQTIQKALKNAGYYKGSIDGKIGRQSKDAIAKFQKDHALVSDGIVGKKTWNQLKTYLN